MSKIARSPRPFIENLIRVTSWELDQIKLYRWMLGGFWIKVHGAWSQAEIVSVDENGGKYLGQGEYPRWNSFHETNDLIEETENYTGY
jgi:hypothetical protein